MGEATRSEVVAAAIADCWAQDGELFASPMGLLPTLGARLCRLTSNPDLVVSDGESLFLASPGPLGSSAGVVEGWIPFRKVFDVVAWGRRHVMMGATQLDRHGNQNISAIGPFDRPARQLLGSRGAPGNTVNNRTSYWVPRHSTRVFVERVDIVTGVGRARAEAAGATRFHDLHRVVTDLAVLDFAGPDGTVRLVSTHPGVTASDVTAATGFDLAVPEAVPTTRQPTSTELMLIREVLDPTGLREREVPS
jgi:acyl CoA:acetate/3-ketoacid CoA transferase beta subunit